MGAVEYVAMPIIGAVGAAGIPPLPLPPIDLALEKVPVGAAVHKGPNPAPKLLVAGRNWACIRGSLICRLKI